MELINDPAPEPSVVFEFDIVGDPVLFHTTPLAVTVAPPVAVTLPPDDEPFVAIEPTEVVLTVGTEILWVVNEI